MTLVFSELLNRLESDQLDFKATSYRWNDEDSRSAFVKDLVCMVNTPRSSDSYIVTGVKKFNDGSYVLLGVSDHPDDADLQGQFADRVYPPPTFRYEIVHHSDKQFGVFVIPPIRTGPCIATRDIGALRQWQVFFRRQSKNSPATPADLESINNWFRGSAVPPRNAYDGGSQGWESLCQITNSFDPSFRYLLILSPSLKASSAQLLRLSSVPWSFVLDFDTGSGSNGALAANREPLSERRSLHVTTLKDQPASILKGATEWCLPRGIDGRPETIAPPKWLDWKKQFGSALTDRIRSVGTRSIFCGFFDPHWKAALTRLVRLQRCWSCRPLLPIFKTWLKMWGLPTWRFQQTSSVGASQGYTIPRMLVRIFVGFPPVRELRFRLAPPSVDGSKKSWNSSAWIPGQAQALARRRDTTFLEEARRLGMTSDSAMISIATFPKS
jgi:hypothetical protein